MGAAASLIVGQLVPRVETGSEIGATRVSLEERCTAKWRWSLDHSLFFVFVFDGIGSKQHQGQ